MKPAKGEFIDSGNRCRAVRADARLAQLMLVKSPKEDRQRVEQREHSHRAGIVHAHSQTLDCIAFKIDGDQHSLACPNDGIRLPSSRQFSATDRL